MGKKVEFVLFEEVEYKKDGVWKTGLVTQVAPLRVTYEGKKNDIFYRVRKKPVKDTAKMAAVPSTKMLTQNSGNNFTSTGRSAFRITKEVDDFMSDEDESSSEPFDFDGFIEEHNITIAEDGREAHTDNGFLVYVMSMPHFVFDGDNEYWKWDDNREEDTNLELVNIHLVDHNDWSWGVRGSFDEHFREWKITSLTTGEQCDSYGIKVGWRIVAWQGETVTRSNFQRIKDELHAGVSGCVTLQKPVDATSSSSGHGFKAGDMVEVISTFHTNAKYNAKRLLVGDRIRINSIKDNGSLLVKKVEWSHLHPVSQINFHKLRTVPQEVQSWWTCTACTIVNEPQHTNCAMCSRRKDYEIPQRNPKRNDNQDPFTVNQILSVLTPFKTCTRLDPVQLRRGDEIMVKRIDCDGDIWVNTQDNAWEWDEPILRSHFHKLRSAQDMPWTCSSCTYDNDPTETVCRMCFRPQRCR